MAAAGEGTTSDFDYGSPEAHAALQGVSRLILEIREEYSEPCAIAAAPVVDPALERKVRLYERTLGLAVLPVLVRRLVYRFTQGTAWKSARR